MSCYHCGASTSNGLALCELCIEGARTYLTAIAVYFRNLARERRPGRPNGSLGTSGQWLLKHGEADDGSAVQRALAHAVNDLTTWTRTLIDDRGLEAPDADDETATIMALCGFLAEHLVSIATLEWAGQFVRDMSRHEKALRQVTEAAVPGWYAGPCQQPSGRDLDGNEHICGADIHVVPGLTWATCQRCGATTHAADHLPAILDEARVWVARPKAIAEALVALIDSEPSVPRLYTRIRQWAHVGDIESIKRTARDHVWSDEAQDFVVGVVEVGHARYQLGQVLDRVLAKDTPAAAEHRAS